MVCAVQLQSSLSTLHSFLPRRGWLVPQRERHRCLNFTEQNQDWMVSREVLIQVCLNKTTLWSVPCLMNWKPKSNFIGLIISEVWCQAVVWTFGSALRWYIFMQGWIWLILKYTRPPVILWHVFWAYFSIFMSTAMPWCVLRVSWNSCGGDGVLLVQMREESGHKQLGVAKHWWSWKTGESFSLSLWTTALFLAVGPFPNKQTYSSGYPGMGQLVWANLLAHSSL